MRIRPKCLRAKIIKFLEQGSPNSGLWTVTSCQISGSIGLEIRAQ